METRIPLKEVMRLVFGFQLETKAELTLAEAIELVLKSRIRKKNKPTKIAKLINEFGLNGRGSFMSQAWSVL